MVSCGPVAAQESVTAVADDPPPATPSDDPANANTPEESSGLASWIDSITAHLPGMTSLRQAVEKLEPSEAEPYLYDRTLPVLGRELAAKGYKFPLPYGISALINQTLQPQSITNASVAVTKGEPPPPGTPLTPIPFVEFTGVEADAVSKQVRFDAWLLPFLNFYGILGSYSGDVDLVVNVDLNEMFPLVCTPDHPCDPVAAPFVAKPRGKSYGLGTALSYGANQYFGVANISYVLSDGENTDDKVSSLQIGARAGRFWNLEEGMLFSAYGGVDYMKIDQVVNGISSLANAFPDGDDLSVRYRVDLANADLFNVVLGLTLGFRPHIGIITEATFGPDSHRYMASLYYRF
jgi:hypothetical protein